MSDGRSILEQLARKLTPMPSLGHLMNMLESSEMMADFVSLIREYVPKSEADIMCKESDYDKVERFSEVFEEKYFPLATDSFDSFDEDEAMNNLMTAIPLILEGYTYDQYHENEVGSNQPAFLAVLAITQYPYTVGDGPGARLPFMEELAKTATMKQVKRIPKDGYSLTCLRYCLKNLQGHENLAGFLYGAEYISGYTGCFVLDADYDGYGGDPWDKETVKALTKQQKEVEKRSDADRKFIDWFDANPPKALQEILDLLEERSKPWELKQQKKKKAEERAKAKKKKAKTLIRVFSDGRSQAVSTLTPTL